ncbi:MAG TPA: C25 family cysteine peptidase [Parafilimonas sp.]|nr:C25 family cysteine peptidase [Parafilimonas sp.]
MLRKILLPCLLIIISLRLAAQPYHNEWIDYSKTYYKFKVQWYDANQAGDRLQHKVIRINQPALAAAGLGGVPAEQFQLWHNGEQVAIYTSKQSGTFGSGDFIEFWGEMANGKLDKELYKDPNWQLSDAWCLSSDSAAYFLTVNSSGSNLRLVPTANNVQNAGSAEKNFTYTVGKYFRVDLSQGYFITEEGLPLMLSSFDEGEGYSSHEINSYLQPFAPLFADTVGTSVTLRVNMLGYRFNSRNVKMFLNGDSVGQVSMPFFASAKSVITGIPASKLIHDSANIRIQDVSFPGDVIRLAQIEFSYQRKFNFGNDSSFEFYVKGSGNGRYLKIVNFNAGTGGAPILYDLTNNKRYVANTDVADTLRFLLDPSFPQYHLLLVRANGSTAKNVTSFESKTYTDYSQAANQGDYLIISNARIYGSGSTNYVEQYRAYRNSAAGGSYNAKLFNISDLEDQFAWGEKMHPLAIKNFLRYARNTFQTPPAYAFLIGKGVAYAQYLLDFQNGYLDQLNLVPTFGNPGSDNLLGSDGFSDVPATPIGRLSAVTANEVGVYLSKVKEYELAQANKSDSIENKSWLKTVLQLTGANDEPSLGIQLDSFMRSYKNIISDTLFGANVFDYSKTANPEGYAAGVLDFTNRYNHGSAVVTYFGHSSNSSLDFNLEDPGKYSNTGRYPFFLVNGCVAGNVFDWDQYGTRFSFLSSLSEKYVLAPSKGSIAFLSTSSFGIVSYLDVFTRAFYKAMSVSEYHNGIGDIVQSGSAAGLAFLSNDFYGRMHAQQYTLHGDPAIRLNGFAKPDYAVQTNSINIDPAFISAANDSFTVKVKIYNLGRAVSDSVHFVLLRYNSNTDSSIVFSRRLPYIEAIDSLLITLPVIPNQDTGTTKYAAYIDDNHKISELSENNNLAYFKISIADNDLRPVYPYNYAIVNHNKISLAASTADPFAQSKKYRLELDTTSLFNSAAKLKMITTSKGGLIEFNGVNLSLNNVVYYWRVAQAGKNPHWNNFSFIYKQDSMPGFEQAHFYQHTESDLDGLRLDTGSRSIQFAPRVASLFAKQTVYKQFEQDNDFSVSADGSLIGWSACVGSSILFNVLDQKTFSVFANTTHPYGAAGGCKPITENNFEFSTQTATSRKNAMDFLDNYVPDGSYVVVRKIYDIGNADWAPTVWAKDTALYGHNNSLYHRFKDQGLSIDSFIFPRTFIFIYKKNDSAHYSPVSVFSKGIYDHITASAIVSVYDTAGTATSPLFGPSKAWKMMTWEGSQVNHNNTTSFDVLGIDNNGNDSLFFTLNKTRKQQDISTINAKKYRNIKLRMHTQDTTTDIPLQLSDWLVSYTPVPEGAVAPNIGVHIPATVTYDHAVNVQYDTLAGYVIFKNISNAGFTMLKVDLSLTGPDGVVHDFHLPRTRSLPAGDTVKVSYRVNVTALPAGRYNLRLEVNPDNDQPEQYHFNNTLYKYIDIVRTAVPQSQVAAAAKASEADVTGVTVFPNPFKEKINIVSNEKGVSIAKVFTVTGQLLLQRNFSGTTQLNIPNLSEGIYLVEITSSSGKQVFKLKKQND